MRGFQSIDVRLVYELTPLADDSFEWIEYSTAAFLFRKILICFGRCKRTKVIVRLCIVLFSQLLLSGISLWAQNPDTSFVAESQATALSFYTASVKREQLVLNGREYFPFDGVSKQFPYFLTEYPEEGEVVYDHEEYSQVLLLYDLVADQLVAEHYDQNGLLGMIVIPKARVQEFRIMGYRFVHLENDLIPKGYYRVLFEGTTASLYQKYKKQRQDIIVNRELRTEFPEKVQFFVFKDRKYYPVGGKRALLKVLEDEKRALREFAARNKFEFSSTDKEIALMKMVSYYEQLKMNP